MRRHLINIVGPTAIGKTSLSIEVAQHFQTEVLSADSRQFFKEMTIGTAVPSQEELAAAPHHFIQHRSIATNYSVGDFEREALAKLEQLFQKHDQLVMVGGSGLYVKAVTEGLDDFPEVDPAIRRKLNYILESSGIGELQQQLEALDPVYFKEVDKENPHRVMRALEICIGTGKTYSSYRKSQPVTRPFNIISIGLTADRDVVYDRINRRVDLMMQEGLLKEARGLYEHRNLNALNTVGYKELFLYLDGEWSLEQAISEMKKNTRRFAKRQLTWFKKTPEIHWFDFETPPEEIIHFLKEQMAPNHGL